MAHRLVLEEDQPRERVDKVLAQRLEGVSRAKVQRWISEDRVRVDGELCNAHALVGAGSVVEVTPGPRPISRAEPEEGVVFGVLYEDPHVIVVDKPAGLVVHPSRGHWTGTLVSGLLARPEFGRPPHDPRDPEGPMRPGIVHRIDKGTSGVLVVAKDEPSREGLKAQLKAHTVERRYDAITVGVPEPGRIETLHGRHPHYRRRYSSEVSEGRVAVTHVTVRQVLAAGAAAFVSCRLETGRTHQIRVHLRERTGTPLLGDPVYGTPAADARVRRVEAVLGRQALHAAVLGFVHPITGQALRFESPLPDDLRLALEELRALPGAIEV